MRARAYTKEDAQQRRDGRWRIHARAFLAQHGRKQLFHTATCYGDSPQDAATKANKFVADQRVEYFKSGTVSKACKDTLAVYGRKWLEARRPKTADDALKRSTWDGYSETFRLYIEEPKDEQMRLGSVRMEHLSIENVVDHYTLLRDTPNARNEKNWGRARSLHTVLRPIFSAYYSADPKNRVNLASALRERKLFGRRKDKKRPRAYTWEQIVAFLKAADDSPYRAFWYLFAFTGARPSELLALTRDDVDLAAAKITISKRIRILPKRCRETEEERWEIDTPKTEGAEHDVLLPAELVPILEQHLGREPARKSAKAKARQHWVGKYGDLVFKTLSRQPVEWGNLRENYRRICRRAGLGTFVGDLPSRTARPRGKCASHPKGCAGHGPAKVQDFKPLLKPYALRHSHATQQLADGVPIEVISERLGHLSGPAFTMSTYVGRQTHRQKLAADAASKRLRSLNTGTEG